MKLSEMNLFGWPEMRGLGEILPGLISCAILFGIIGGLIALVVINTAPSH